MKELGTLAGILLLGFSISAFGDSVPLDPTGFCAPPGGVSACTTATGLVQGGSAETIGINGTSFDMEKNGSGTSDSIWYLIAAIPDYTGPAPSITSSSFTLASSVSPNPVNDGNYTSSSTDLYSFTGLQGPNSMNATNMFGTNEQSAFGGTPSFFDVFVYAFTGAFDSNTAYNFTVGGSGLPAGTFLAASGDQSNPGAGFATPFTTTGLVNGPGCPDCGQGNEVPEPSQLAGLLLGAGLVGFVQFRRLRQSA